MTDPQAAVETLADRIAQRGREALVERLRKAYSDAASAHADIVTLNEERIEGMVQAAADRADGLQWRRALANVAADELGLSLAEALTHPAVARAQELVGAPSYEAGLAELIAQPVPPPAPASQNGARGVLESVDADDTYVELLPEPSPADDEQAPLLAQAPAPEPELTEEPVLEIGEHELSGEPELHEPSGELDVVEADDQVFELLPPPEPIDYEADEAPLPALVAPDDYVGEPTEAHQLEEAEEAEDAAPSLEVVPEGVYVSEPPPAEESYGGDYGSEHVDYPPPEASELRVMAYHLGGVANLPTGRNGLDLRLSESGLDILQQDGDIIGRLHWDEIDSLEVNAVKGRLRRQARSQSRIVVRTKHGDASFEIPGFTSDELGARVDPLLSRYASAS